jgi:UDP-glucuronate 4-epimerase
MKFTKLEDKKTVLITGIAGFIGFHLAKKLSDTFFVIGLDNLNNYYDINLKIDRLKELGINIDNNCLHFKSSTYPIDFYKIDLNDNKSLLTLLNNNKIDCIIHLAAQAGVRYSLINSKTYIENNINAFYNVLESMKLASMKNIIYASSSSVYGSNEKVPFKESDKTNNQVSLYAATKKTNEILAQTYSNLYKLKCVGLRFFTVYGPFGRPDMAYYKFSDMLMKNQEIQLYNYGNQTRDYTHINDITSGIKLILDQFDYKKIKPIYNIGSGYPIELKKLINELESNFNRKFKVKEVEHQQGDVKNTLASIDQIKEDFGFSIKSNFEDGIKEFTNWFKNYNAK